MSNDPRPPCAGSQLTSTSMTRAGGGPCWHQATRASTFERSPSATASTRPSRRFLTQPSIPPSRRAASTVARRRAPPCTRPEMRTSARAIMPVPVQQSVELLLADDLHAELARLAELRPSVLPGDDQVGLPRD